MPTMRPASIAAIEPTLPLLERGIDGLRIVTAGGYFRKGASPEALDALDAVAKALGAREEIEIPEAASGPRRGLCHHLHRRRGAASRPPAQTGQRFRSRGARPADRRRHGAVDLVVKAQIFRRWYRDRVLELFKDCDAILAPATPDDRARSSAR